MLTPRFQFEDESVLPTEVVKHLSAQNEFLCKYVFTGWKAVCNRGFCQDFSRGGRLGCKRAFTPFKTGLTGSLTAVHIFQT
jgi:hypothetical protein